MKKFTHFDLFDRRRIEKNEEFWRDQCGLKIDRQDIIVLGAGNQEYSRGIIFPKELLVLSNNHPHEFLCAKMKERFPIDVDGDLDKQIIKNVRWPNSHSYLVYFRDRPEADLESAGLNANDVGGKKFSGITCAERLIYEWQYFWETGEHLDQHSITICSGSLKSNDFVVSVNCHGGKVRIGWLCSTEYSDKLRIRFASVDKGRDLRTRLVTM